MKRRLTVGIYFSFLTIMAGAGSYLFAQSDSPSVTFTKLSILQPSGTDIEITGKGFLGFEKKVMSDITREKARRKAQSEIGNSGGTMTPELRAAAYNVMPKLNDNQLRSVISKLHQDSQARNNLLDAYTDIEYKKMVRENGNKIDFYAEFAPKFLQASREFNWIMVPGAIKQITVQSNLLNKKPVMQLMKLNNFILKNLDQGRYYADLVNQVEFVYQGKIEPALFTKEFDPTTYPLLDGLSATIKDEGNHKFSFEFDSPIFAGLYALRVDDRVYGIAVGTPANGETLCKLPVFRSEDLDFAFFEFNGDFLRSAQKLNSWFKKRPARISDVRVEFDKFGKITKVQFLKDINTNFVPELVSDNDWIEGCTRDLMTLGKMGGEFRDFQSDCPMYSATFWAGKHIYLRWVRNSNAPAIKQLGVDDRFAPLLNRVIKDCKQNPKAMGPKKQLNLLFVYICNTVGVAKRLFITSQDGSLEGFPVSEWEKILPESPLKPLMNYQAYDVRINLSFPPRLHEVLPPGFAYGEY